MRKINLLFLSLMLVFASAVFAQDVVYLDFDRTGWKAKSPEGIGTPVDAAIGNALGGENTGKKLPAEAKYLLDGNTGTFLSMVKPGKTYEGVAGPDELTDLGFYIDMGSAKLFDYFRFVFRTNAYAYLRPWKISIYGSNDVAPTFTTGTWIQITDKSGNNIISLTGADVDGAPYDTGNIDLANTVSYRFIKVVYEEMSSSTSGSSLQVAEFYTGKTTTDKVIENPGDVAFGDIEKGISVKKTLPIKGYNLNNLSYTISGDGASAFSYVKSGTANSTNDTIVITFAPAEKKAYTAELTINMNGALSPQTIALTGNADFDLPVQISSADNSNEHWYYIQFERQATASTVLTVANPVEGDTIKQLPLDSENVNQLWKVTGTWDNYKLINKSNQSIVYVYAPKGEDPVTGNEIPEVNRYLTKAAANSDLFGFVRYNTTDTWQLKNTSTTIATNNRYYLNDQSGLYVGGYTLNNAGNQLNFIDASAASIIVPDDTVKIGSVNRNSSEVLGVEIAAVKLTGNISVTITEDEDQVYTLGTSTLSSKGGRLELTFAPKAYKKVSYATISLTSGSVSKTFVVSATSDVGISKYYVGEETQWGVREDGEIVAAIPTTLKAKDEVWIAEGEYSTAQITAVEGVAIYGGFAGTETSVDERAVGSKAWEFTNASVLKNTASLVISITGANVIVDGITFEGTSTVGRAIQNISASGLDVIIRNNIIRNFNSNADGGGMNIRYKTEIYNCLITANKANKGGGAYLDNVIIHDCEITNNSAPTTAANSIGNVNGGGGGLLLVASEAYNLHVEGNVASYGGGLFPRTTSKVYNSIVVNNTATSGGGISFDERDSNTLIYNITVASNKATLQGGTGGVNFASDGKGTRTAKLYNSILWNNTDVENEIYNIGLSGGTTENPAFAEPEIKNIIIDDLEFYTEESPTLVIVDGVQETEGTALFVAAGSWVTSSTSPGREKGFIELSEEIIDPETQEVTPAVYLEFATGKDYAGGQRIAGTIDIGPYEDQSNASSVTKPEVLDGNVIETKYYNIHGVEVISPVATGIYIKKELLDTNKTRVTKILFESNNR